MLIIFDCDGVLVDTEPESNRCFAAALNQIGLNWSVDQTIARLVGRSMKSCIEIVEREIGRNVPADFVMRLQQHTFESFRRDGVRTTPGIVAALDALDAARVPYCVASSGEIDKMRLTLGLSGLLPRFERQMFSATMVARGKPFPDLFLHAARSMGAAPADCVVVEDAVPGVTAAGTAGMRALAYAAAPHTDRAGLAASGGALFDDMTRLPALLGIAVAG
ncbi:MAG: HAD-IA family hydrolase [Rhodospirillales bacterium]